MSTLAVTDAVLRAFADEVGPATAGPVAVEGSRTRWDVGGPAAAGTRLLRAPTGIVAYAASEMTVQVRAGTTVAELDAALAEHGQRSALPDRGGTVGGGVAVGENAFDVLGRGRLRDAVLQVRYAGADGELVTGGGPVVKNVTGFNLPKLMTGSLGTLGLFVEFVLRTNPIPPAARWLAAPGADPAAVFAALHHPAAVAWDGETTWVLLEGHGPDIDAEHAVLRGLGAFDEVEGPPQLPEHRWSLPAAEMTHLDPVGTGAFVASIGVGVVHADRPQPTRPSSTGSRGADRSGTDPGAQLAARIKANFDPTGRLNPGRRPGD